MTAISRRMVAKDTTQTVMETLMQWPFVSPVHPVQAYEMGVHCQIVVVIITTHSDVAMPIRMYTDLLKFRSVKMRK